MTCEPEIKITHGNSSYSSGLEGVLILTGIPFVAPCVPVSGGSGSCGIGNRSRGNRSRDFVPVTTSSDIMVFDCDACKFYVFNVWIIIG